MKHLNKYWLGAFVFLIMASCADDNVLDFNVQKPESIAAQEYLQDYDVLKSYIDRSANPNFKLGAGVSVDDYVKTGADYAMITSNFDEMTAGWEMKHGAVVQNDGSLNLSKVDKFITTAKAAGVTIYGHTLTWHANQNAKYLNSLIAPTVIPGAGGPSWETVTENDFETDDASNYQSNSNAVMSFTADGEGANGEGRALKISNDAVRANDWDSQFFITFSPATQVGEKYRLTMDVKADDAASFPTQAHTVPYSYKFYNFFGSVNATTEWTTMVVEITIDDNTSGCTAIAFNLGATATNYYFDNVHVEWLNPEGGGPTWDVVSANDFESDDASNYQGNTNAVMSFTADGAGAEGSGRALKITNDAVRANDWDSQFFITFPTPTELGQKYKLEMDVKADAPATFPTQAHIVPYSYKFYDFFGQVSATTEWTHFSKEITIDANTEGVTAIAFNLGATATSYYFDNFQVEWYNEDGGGDEIIEKTPEEKKDTLTYALENWISGMMTASKDYVKAWDVVNEPMDDGNPYELKTGVGKTDMADDEFYWQDYLGKDYAVVAFNLARKYGNKDDKLFINDYNLEYNLDKCKGLIQFVEYIEDQGATVDGIGTQMHINIDSDKDKIAEMFKLLAATGKLVKISELDMGVGAKTIDATPEQLEAQAEMYKYVVQKYFELIPANQRYGITVWSPKDSPEESSWRPGEPIGLWKENYDRKPAYASFAEALGGQTK